MGKYFADVHASRESQFQALPHGLSDTDEILICRAKPQTYETLLELADALCWQLRAGKADEAQKSLRQHYRPDMYVGHHTAYEKAMRAADSGSASATSQLPAISPEAADRIIITDTGGSIRIRPRVLISRRYRPTHSRGRS